MATTIKLKNSVTTTSVPSSLVQGEVAINITDKKVWVGNAATTPIQLLGDGGSASFTSIAFGDGTVSAPSITNIGDTNTGIYFPAADTIAFTEGGVEAARFDSSGQLLVGTTTALAQTTIYKAGSGLQVSSPQLTVQNNVVDGGSGDGAGINFANATGAVANIGSTGDGQFFFSGRATSGAGWTTRMRIDASGNFMFGTATQISSGFTTISYSGAALNGVIISESASTSGTTFLGFNSGATNIGNVSRVGATNAVIYNTTSDQRLKSNIADANPVLDKLMTVKVRQFDWTEGDLHQDAGFIAQELKPVLSGIVTEGKTEEDMWQVDYSRLTPYLVKAVQELNAKVDAQALEIATLKAK